MGKDMEENKTNDEIINPISEYVMTDSVFVYYSPGTFGTVLIIILYLQLIEQSGSQGINFLQEA
jgi:hypothetical protein